MTCSICERSDRAEIDAALAAGGRRGVSARFGVSQGRLARHAKHAGSAARDPARIGSTSRSSPNSGTNAEAIVALDVEARAIALRVAGKAYDEIAADLGLPRSTAHGIVARALRRRREVLGENLDTVREIEAERLERLHAAHWSRATEATGEDADPDAATTTTLRIAERRAKLLGLDAPSTTYAIDVILAHPATADLWRETFDALEMYPGAKEAVSERLTVLRARYGVAKRAEMFAPVRATLGIDTTSPGVTAAINRSKHGDEDATRAVERFAMGINPDAPFDLDAFIARLVEVVPEIAPRLRLRDIAHTVEDEGSAGSPTARQEGGFGDAE